MSSESDDLNVNGLTIEQISDTVRESDIRKCLNHAKDVQLDVTGKRAIVTFRRDEDIHALLENGSIQLCGEYYEVFPINGKICVSGLPERVSEEAVELFFENKKRSGGGDIDHADIKLKDRFAVITFTDIKVAFRVADREQLSMDGCEIEVSLYNPFKKMATIYISGLNPNTSPDTLEMFFESQKRSGGGEIEKLEHFATKGKAIITFVDLEDAKRVLSKETLALEEYHLTVTSTKENTGIIVKGLRKTTTRDTVEMFFESNKRSGGGPIKNIMHNADGGMARIVYEHATDAERVLNKCGLKIEGAILDVIYDEDTEEFFNLLDCSVTTDIDSAPHSADASKIATVLVEGLKADTPHDKIKLFFENEKRSGGGTIVAIEGKGQSSAIITFADYLVAERVLTRHNLKIAGSLLRVSASSQAGALCKGMTRAEANQYLSLEVALEDEKHDQNDIIRMFMENKSSGGEVVSCQYYEDDGVYIVTFTDTEAAQNVMERSSREEFTIENAKITVKPVETNVATTTSAIVVHNPRRLSDKEIEHLTLFFENKASGGGTIESAFIDKDKAIFTFCDPNVALNVLKVQEKKGLEWCGMRLNVEMLKRPKPPSLTVGTIEKDKLIVSNISQSAKTEDLIQFLELKSDCKVQRNGVSYGLRDGRALIEFNGIPDYAAVRDFSGQKPLCDKILCVQQVELPDSIQIDGISEISEDMLKVYFQNDRSGGGPIRDLKIHPHIDDCAVIQFVDRKVITRILKKTHKLNGKILNVRVYYESLGVIPCGRDPSDRFPDIPDDIDMTDVDFDIIHLIDKSADLKATLDKQMQSAHCQVIWEKPLGNPKLVLRCTLEPSKVFKYGKDWRTTALEACATFIETFDKTTMEIGADVWPAFLRAVGDLNQFDSSHVKVKVESHIYALCIYGKSSLVTDTENKLRVFAKRAGAEIEYNKRLVTEKITDLKSWQTEVLKASGFEQEMASLDPTIKTMISDHDVTFMAAATVIPDAKVRMYEIIHECKKDARRYSDLFCNFLDDENIKHLVTDKFSNIPVIKWVVENQMITIFAKGMDLTSNAFSLLEDIVQEVEITADQTGMEVLKTTEWIEFIKEKKSKLDNKLELLIAIEPVGASIHLVTLTTYSSQVKAEIERFISENTMTEEKIDLDDSAAKLIQKHLQQKLREIGSQFINTYVSLEDTAGSPYLKIRCGRGTIKKASQEVQAFLDAIQTEDHVVSKPGMKNYFGNRSLDFVNALENNHKAVVSILADSVLTKTSRTIGSIPDGIIEEIALTPDVTVTVAAGDITTFPVDAILCSSNSQMELKHGLARVLASKGGSLQADCARSVQRNGCLHTGEVRSVPAGTLQCQTVFFILAPKWRGTGNETDTLMKAFSYCLAKADKMGYTSVAIPAVGVGNKIPESMVTDTIAKAVLEARTTSIKKIYFMDTNKNTGHKFITSLKKIMGGDTSKPKKGSIKTIYSKIDNKTVKTKECVTVNLVFGNIAKQKADVIVNTTSPALTLKEGGALSCSILKAAGPEIQQECSAIGSVRAGEIAVTKGYKLDCKTVFHGTCPNWKRDREFCERTIRQFVQACLKSADRSGFTSIAIPAIGTGRNHVPPNLCAQLMYQEIATFSATYPSALKEVKLVVFDKDKNTILAFEALLQSFGASSSSVNMERKREIGKSSICSARPKTSHSVTKAQVVRAHIVTNRNSKAKPRTFKQEGVGSMILRVCADCKESLQQAMGYIDNIYIKEFKKDILSSPQDKSNIAALDDCQISDIKSVESRYAVLITINRESGRESIVLEGCTCHVMMAKEAIRTVFSNAQRMETKKRMTVLRSHQVQWYYLEDGEWLKYELDFNNIIEEAWETKQEYAEWTEESGETFKVDFQRMMEEPAGAGVGIHVKRKSAESAKLPACWESQAPEDVVQLFTLASASPEYRNIEESIRQTDGGAVKKIKSIQRVQNPSMYLKYLVHKEAMDKQNPTGTVNERQLWHGTAADTVESICHNGFNRGYCGKNATAYGKGVYFAKDLSYSVKYTTKNAKGDRQVFYCSVLTGMFTKGSSAMTVTPIRSGNIHFDSVVDDSKTPSMYVIFSDTQAYPSYLITFI